jgi:hypothetical protein
LQAEAHYTEAFALERVHKAATSHSTGALLHEMQAALKGEGARVKALRAAAAQLAGTVTTAGAAATAEVLDGLHALVTAKLQVRHLAHSMLGRARASCSLARVGAEAVRCKLTVACHALPPPAQQGFSFAFVHSHAHRELAV